jgi:hypothetical protein
MITFLMVTSDNVTLSSIMILIINYAVYLILIRVGMHQLLFS